MSEDLNDAAIRMRHGVGIVSLLRGQLDSSGCLTRLGWSG